MKVVASKIDFEQQMHTRLLARDPTASEELAREYLPLVKQHVRIRALQHGIQDQDLINDATVEAVFDYIRKPEKFNPQKSGLLGYLKRAAERDLMNEVQKDRRRRRGEELHEDVELSVLARNKTADVERIRRVEEMATISHIQKERELAQSTKPRNERDNALLRLMAEGERSTDEFAAVLGIGELPIVEQRRIVKQHKDRLKAQLKREGRNRRA